MVPTTEEMLMILPHRARTMSRENAFVQWNVPSRFVRRTSCQSSSFMRSRS